MSYSPSTIIKAVTVGLGSIAGAYLTASNGGASPVDIFQWFGVVGAGLVSVGALFHSPTKESATPTIASVAQEIAAAAASHTELAAVAVKAINDIKKATDELVLPVTPAAIQKDLSITVNTVEGLVEQTIQRAQAALPHVGR